MASARRQRADNKITVEEYLSWIETRPSEERWQLIDGTAMLMTPPTLRHQRIASNLARLLNDRLKVVRPTLYAYHEVGLIVPDVDLFRPEADVAILDAMAPEGSYATRFYLVAEVLSDSNTEKEIAFKRMSYVAHPDNLYMLIVDQKHIRLEVLARTSGWQAATFTGSDALLDLPEFGFQLPLGELYRGTPLAP